MQLLVLIGIMAAVTFALRALPITIFKKEIKSKWLKSFLYYIPYAVLGAMTFPAIFFSTGSVISASFSLIGAVIVSFFDLGLTITAATAVIIAYICAFFL